MPELMCRDKDFFFISRSDSEAVIRTVISLCKTRLPKTYKYDPLDDIQVITPMRKGDMGCINLNKELQKALNVGSKKSKDTNTYSLKVGDKVMQVRNNYDVEWEIDDGDDVEYGEGIFNGDIGVIKTIDFEGHTIKVLFEEEKLAEYDFDSLDELELAYAMTAHKSQGSEFSAVIIPLLTGPDILLTRNLLYTAVTRAKKLVIIVGESDVVSRMVGNQKENKKFSALAERIVHNT